jgi:DNA repair photolyase
MSACVKKPKAERIKPRYTRVNTCQECKGCADFSNCVSAKAELDNSYKGVRFSADGFDCALPVSMDSHTMCSYKCIYCFSNFLEGHNQSATQLKQFNLKRLENILAGNYKDQVSKNIWIGLKRDQKQPCPIQLGALNDPFDNIERQQGWALQLPALLKKYNQPCRISTKGVLLGEPEYLDAFSVPDIFWVAFSLISIDDELLAKIDRKAPSATQRIETMRRLSARGVSTSLRFRPIMPNLSDRTEKHPNACKELIEKCAEAGAKAVSMEAIFTPSVIKPEKKKDWDMLEEILRLPLRKIYGVNRIKGGACNRLRRELAEDIFYLARDTAHKCGMTFASSDPLFKHLNDTGCCCGIRPDDPVFGNWQRENATNAVVDARSGLKVSAEAYIPKWSRTQPMKGMCFSTNAMSKVMENTMWSEKLRNGWNDLKSNRGVLYYLQGILKPVGVNAIGDIEYVYDEPVRKHIKNQLFRV